MSVLIILIFFKSVCLCMQQLVLAVYERFLNPRQKYYWTPSAGGGGGRPAGEANGSRSDAAAAAGCPKGAAVSKNSDAHRTASTTTVLAEQHHRHQRRCGYGRRHTVGHQRGGRGRQLHDERVWGLQYVNSHSGDTDVDEELEEAGRATGNGKQPYADGGDSAAASLRQQNSYRQRAALSAATADVCERRERDCELLLQQVRARKRQRATAAAAAGVYRQQQQQRRSVAF